jgi:3-deoxy-D-manno-octulosonic-acid transferase
MTETHKARLLRQAYTLAGFAALPLIGLRVLWKSRQLPAYRAHLKERFGLAPASTGPLIWIHAVSVGETRAVAPLVRALLEHAPQHHILLTAMTPTGRAMAQSLFSGEDRVRYAYLPWDFPFAVRRFLERTKPVLGIVMETEWWPNLMAEAQARGCPMALINARLSARSARGYARVRALVGPLLRSFSCIGAQTEEDAKRLAALGASAVTVTGNLKFDSQPPPTLLAQGADWKAAAGGRPIGLLASSREGEEALFLTAWLKESKPLWPETRPLWVVVPRHPQRFESVANAIQKAGFVLGRRSLGPPQPDMDMWLGDSMGELYAYYAMADVAVMGGSWAPLGGQNPIEACAVGTPVILGPHTFNFEQVCTVACEEGAAVRAHEPNNALHHLQALLSDPLRLSEMKEQARAFAARHQGATRRTVDLLAPWL